MDEEESTAVEVRRVPHQASRLAHVGMAALAATVLGAVAEFPGTPPWFTLALGVSFAVVGGASVALHLMRMWAVQKLVNTVCEAASDGSGGQSRDRRVKEAADLAARLNRW